MQRLLGDDPSIVFIRDAILATGELVTTATIERDQCELTATYDGELLRVEVGEVPRVLVHCDHPDVTAADLGLVTQVVSRWGVRPVGNRATIWFEMDECTHCRSTPTPT